MIRIVDPGKYYECLSCGRSSRELLRTFEVGRDKQIYSSITLCTECLGELVKQEILYQPRECEKWIEQELAKPKEIKEKCLNL